MTNIYTKEMVDAGVMPSVGMEVMHLSVKKVVMLLADSNSKYALKSVNDFYSLALAHDIKPLDTRTDKEKAFDKFLDDNYNSTKEEFCKSQSDRDFIEGLELAFNHGVTWSKS